MKRFGIGILAFGAALGVAAQQSSLPRYKVLHNSRDKVSAAQWNAAADQGYRLLFEARVAVMRLDAAPPDTYRYQALPDRNLRATFLNALNEQGAFGYGWIANTHMLQKLPHPRTYEYAVVDGIAAKTRAHSLDDLTSQGFCPVGRFGTVPIYMRETGASPGPAISACSLRRLERTNRGKLLKQINAAGREGYRYRGNEIGDKGDVLVMEDCGASGGGPFEYRSFDFKTAAQLESELNTLGAQGFRVVMDSLGYEPSVVERGATSARYAYRVGEAKDPVVLEQFLNAGDRDGFVPLGFAAHVGWTVDVVMVLEKATAVAQAQ